MPDPLSVAISAGAVLVAGGGLIRSELVRRSDRRDRELERRRKAKPTLAVEIADWSRPSNGLGIDVRVTVVNVGFAVAREVRVGVTWLSTSAFARLRPTERLLAAGGQLACTVRLPSDAVGGLGAMQLDPNHGLEAFVEFLDELDLRHIESSNVREPTGADATLS